MENMVASRQQTQHFVVFKLAQAHRALERSFADLQILSRGVDEDREGLNHGTVETVVPWLAGGDHRTVVVGGGGGGGCLKALPDVDGKKGHEEEGDHEEHDDHRHRLIEIGVWSVRIIGNLFCTASLRIGEEVHRGEE
ncbi:hypothetical protein F2P56_014203 [Juglans regia]|uniref:Uncharacterized protein n=1 Tax=Juglans regia TaxID=51240 RepID=A0A834CMI1_JUGRE|nr:hypothetical protein F2P56_014203 [Juglans regia]